jgi:hypothetical protein
MFLRAEKWGTRIALHEAEFSGVTDVVFWLNRKASVLDSRDAGTSRTTDV